MAGAIMRDPSGSEGGGDGGESGVAGECARDSQCRRTDRRLRHHCTTDRLERIGVHAPRSTALSLRCPRGGCSTEGERRRVAVRVSYRMSTIELTDEAMSLAQQEAERPTPASSASSGWRALRWRSRTAWPAAGRATGRCSRISPSASWLRCSPNSRPRPIECFASRGDRSVRECLTLRIRSDKCIAGFGSEDRASSRDTRPRSGDDFPG